MSIFTETVIRQYEDRTEYGYMSSDKSSTASSDISEGKFILHRDNDLPAIEYADGNKFWYREGKLHRDNDLPAQELANRGKVWYRDGKLHRDNDLPAVENANGDKYWYREGKFHRDNDLPAIEYANGNKSWYRNDVKYNIDAEIPTKNTRQEIINSLSNEELLAELTKRLISQSAEI